MFRINHQYWIGQVSRGLFTGLLTGLAITLYSFLIFTAGQINAMYPFLILFIPAAALLTQQLYKRFGEKFRASTVSAIDDINNHRHMHKNWAQSQVPESISPALAALAAAGALLTHLTGASGGKEGAGVQVGLACSSVIEKAEAFANSRLKREHDNRSDYYLMCGAGAAFSSLFASPVAGFLFGTQLASPRATRLDAYLPCMTASFTSYLVSSSLGCHILTIPDYSPLPLEPASMFKVVLFALLTGLYARLFCFALRSFRSFFQKHIKNSSLAIAAPALLLLASSLAVFYFTGSFRYNGLGGSLLEQLILGQANNIDDLIKLVMVALTYAAGFVGGEVVPLMIVGAGFGMSMSFVFNAPLSAFAVLGSIGMLSGGTNLPLVCFALGLELYSYSEPALLFLMCCLSFIASGKNGIYSHQNLPYR